MTMPSILGCVGYFRQRFRKPNTTGAIYIILFSYFVSYNITWRLGSVLPPEVAQLDTYSIKNVTINPVDCSFPISSQYQRTPRCICYLLLIFTVVVRNHGWLAAGAAASVLTYSGVAAFHSLILFATNNRFHLQQAKTRCDSIPFPAVDTQFVACAGIVDPDIETIELMVDTVMLGALPVITRSNTFKKSASKAILMFWLLLLAVSNAFNRLTAVRQNLHFQICPEDYVEPLPKPNFQASLLDDAWLESFHSLVSVSQQTSSFLDNNSVPACLYSCFATPAYIGRDNQNIIVYTLDKLDPFFKAVSAGRRIGMLAIWWGSVFVAIFTFFITEKKDWFPKRMREPVCSVKYRQQSWIATWKRKNKNKRATSTVIQNQGRGNDITIAHPLAAAESHPMKHFQITFLRCQKFQLHYTSIAGFCGSVFYSEIKEKTQQKTFLEQEQFAAVGQWSYVAVVILVLFAAVVGRIWAADERGGGVGNVTVDPIRSFENGDERRDKEWMDMEEWDYRVGYAS